jgi:2-polyprenyl-3-methyl-5-hydroxy-6-metoxy-1,4-benzoquinol methylase
MRSQELEIMDLGPAHYTQEEYNECLVQLAQIGRYLGGDVATLNTFKHLRTPGSILEIGCGGGQFTQTLAKMFPNTQVTGYDISPDAIAFAKRHSLPNLEFTLTLPPEATFDIVTSTLVCHHLNDQELIEFLKNAYKMANKAVIINDLHRSKLAYYGFAMISGLFFRNRLIRHDGLLSIKRAFKKQELIDFLKAAEIPLEYCTITWHWAFRWVVTLHKP